LVSPDAVYASGAKVPVTRKDGTVRTEDLDELVYEGVDDWNGADHQPTGLSMGIYPIKRPTREKKPFLF